MIETNKSWRRFCGYKNIEANHDNFVVILHETKDGHRCMDHAIYSGKKWVSAHDIPENRVLGYYEVAEYTMCRVDVSDKIDSIPADFRGEAFVLWEWNKEYDGTPREKVFTGVKLSHVINQHVAYSIDHPRQDVPDCVVGYHILPDRFFGAIIE